MASNEDTDTEASEQVLLINSENGTPRRRKQIGWASAAVMITNSAIGAGLLAFPSAFAHAGGYLVAICLLVTIALFSAASLMICAYCSTLCRCANYQQMVSRLVSRAFGTVCALQMFLYTFGSCISYLIILGDQCDQVYAFVAGDIHQQREWYVSRRFLTVVISTLVVLPLCLPKRIEFLRYVSAATNIGLLYLVALVVSGYFFDLGKEPHGGSQTRVGDAESVINSVLGPLLSALPIVCFGFQCEINAIPVYAAQKRRTTGEFARVNVSAIAFTCLVYALTGAFGYATFGDAVQSDVLLSYVPSAPVAVAVVIICVLMLSAYPLMSFVARSTVAEFLAQLAALCAASPSNASADETLHDVLLQSTASVAAHDEHASDPLSTLAGGDRSRERLLRVGVTLVWFASTLCLAVFIPDLGNVIGVLGTFAACFIFVYPGLCLLCLTLALRDLTSSSGYPESVLVNASTSDYGSQSTVRITTARYYALLCTAVLFIVLGTLLFGCTLTQAITRFV